MSPSVECLLGCVLCVRVRVRQRVSHRYHIKQEAVAVLSGTQSAGFFVNGGIMEEGDTWLKHD